jgi:hypothetical protein
LKLLKHPDAGKTPDRKGGPDNCTERSKQSTFHAKRRWGESENETFYYVDVGKSSSFRKSGNGPEMGEKSETDWVKWR